MDFQLFKNHYLITDSTKETKIEAFKHQSFQELTIHSSSELNVHQAHSDEVSVLLLGIALDPFRPDYTNNDIANHLAQVPPLIRLTSIFQIHLFSFWPFCSRL